MTTFEEFWAKVQNAFKALPASERRFRKEIGIAPDVRSAKGAYLALLEVDKSRRPEQMQIDFSST